MALSRARSPAGLQVKGFSPACVSVHALSLDFHAAVERGSSAALGFVDAAVSRWWRPLLSQHDSAKKWRRLFETSSSFRSWVLRLGGGGDTCVFTQEIQKAYANGTVPAFSKTCFIESA